MIAKVWAIKNRTDYKNMLIVKNLQFVSNQADILAKWQAHVKVILIEYQLDWMKIAGFLSIAHFCACPSFYCSYLKLDITFNCYNIKFHNSYHSNAYAQNNLLDMLAQRELEYDKLNRFFIFSDIQ